MKLILVVIWVLTAFTSIEYWALGSPLIGRTSTAHRSIISTNLTTSLGTNGVETNSGLKSISGLFSNPPNSQIETGQAINNDLVYKSYSKNDDMADSNVASILYGGKGNGRPGFLRRSGVKGSGQAVSEQSRTTECESECELNYYKCVFPNSVCEQKRVDCSKGCSKSV